MSRRDLDNRSDQLNPNNDAYYQSRGYDGRNDYYADEDTSGWRSYSGAMPEPPRTQQEIATQGIRRNVVRRMTPEKAGNSICDYLRYLFEDMLLVSTNEDSNVVITALNCVPESLECQDLIQSIRCWLMNQRWSIADCVTSITLALQDCSRMNLYSDNFARAQTK